MNDPASSRSVGRRQPSAATIQRLSGGLIVSSQAMDPRSPLGRPELLVLLARAAELGGPAGFRVDGAEVVRRLRAATTLPIIGIAKHEKKLTDTYITPFAEDVVALVEAGADIVAAQATAGSRPAASFRELVLIAHGLGVPIMADISDAEEAAAAASAGADLVATTLVGFTPATIGVSRPPLDLVAELVASLAVPVVVEGGVESEDDVAQSFRAGAFAVVAGSAVTAPDLITRRFVAATPAAPHHTLPTQLHESTQPPPPSGP